MKRTHFKAVVDGKVDETFFLEKRINQKNGRPYYELQFGNEMCLHVQSLTEYRDLFTVPVKLLPCPDNEPTVLMNNVHTEFPDYDDVLPDLEGFYDSSLDVDRCPSISSRVFGHNTFPAIQIYCDYKNPIKRKHSNDPRYEVCDCQDNSLFKSDDWNVVKEYLKKVVF